MIDSGVAEDGFATLRRSGHTGAFGLGNLTSMGGNSRILRLSVLISVSPSSHPLGHHHYSPPHTPHIAIRLLSHASSSFIPHQSSSEVAAIAIAFLSPTGASGRIGPRTWYAPYTLQQTTSVTSGARGIARKLIFDLLVVCPFGKPPPAPGLRGCSNGL